MTSTPPGAMTVGPHGARVAAAMTREVHTLQVHEPMDRLKAVFDRDEVAVVVDGDQLVGLITPVDLINHLRRTAQ